MIYIFQPFDEMHEGVEETFNLDELICDSVEYFNDISITKNITLECDVEPLKILMDRTKTQKVVNNIISNAIKYSNPNSIIKVSLKDAVFIVQDFGIGISEADQRDIFKRYKRAKDGSNIEGGFGIGLDIVKRISLEYKLKLGLVSKIDEGSTFSIDFSSIVVTSQ